MAIGLKIINGDFSIVNKQLELVSDVAKTRRDFVKFLTTESEYAENTTTYNRYNPQYGTELGRQNLYKNLSIDAIVDLMNLKLEQAMKYYISLQESRTNLSLAEIITDMSYVVYKDLYESQMIRFQIDLRVASGEEVPTENFSQRVI